MHQGCDASSSLLNFTAFFQFCPCLGSSDSTGICVVVAFSRLKALDLMDTSIASLARRPLRPTKRTVTDESPIRTAQLSPGAYQSHDCSRCVCKFGSEVGDIGGIGFPPAKVRTSKTNCAANGDCSRGPLRSFLAGKYLLAGWQVVFRRATLADAVCGPRAGLWRIRIVVAKRPNDATIANVGDVLATVGRRSHHVRWRFARLTCRTCRTCRTCFPATKTRVRACACARTCVCMLERFGNVRRGVASSYFPIA